MTYSLHTDKSWAATMQELGETFEKWGVKEWDTNYPKGARLEGYRQSEEDRTVRLTYQKNGKPVNLTMGKQARAVDNLRVLYLAVEAIRMNEKREIGDVIQSAYLQLAAPVQERSPWEVLGIVEGSSVEVAEAVYRTKVKQVHPDVGGSDQQMKALNKAIEDIRNLNTKI